MFLKHCVRIFTYPVFSPFCTLHVSWNPVHTTYIYIWCSDRAIAIVELCGVKKNLPHTPLRQYKNLSSIYHHLKQQTIALHNMLTHFHTCTIRHRANKITILMFKRVNRRRILWSCVKATQHVTWSCVGATLLCVCVYLCMLPRRRVIMRSCLIVCRSW